MLISKLRTLLIITTLLTSVFGAVCPIGSALIPNCATCTVLNNNIVCSTCLNGYYLSSSICIQCSTAITNCSQCSLSVANQPLCFICQNNFGLLNGLCSNCSSIVGCASCRITNYYLQCTACTVGLVLYSAQMQCVPCQVPNCNNCAISNLGNFTCSSCSLGYYLSSNVCYPCSQKITYCSNCQFDTNNRIICLQCANTLLYLSNNTCLANCSKGGYPRCSVCQLISLTTNTMSCLACIANYYLDSGSLTCQLCSDAIVGCSSCQSTTSISGNSTVNTVRCSGCASIFFLSNPTTCVLCSTVKANCQTCNFNLSANTGQCLTCALGYYLNSTDLACYTCSVSPANSCSSCSMNATSMVCTACLPSYYLMNGLCTTCSQSITNCSTCSYNQNGFTCSSCISGSIINGAKKCSLCSAIYPFCSVCNSVQCTDCQVGYYTVNNKICLINCMVTNCNQCAVKNNSKCALCNTGYSLTNQFTCAMIGCTSPLSFNGIACICPHQSYYQQAGNTCQPCTDTSCEQCPSNKCTKCLDGYFYMNNTSCVKCTSNCQYCNSTKNCLLCAQGFYFSNGACLSYNEVVVGNIGIILVNNFYTLCSMGCIQCSQVSCLSCQVGYYLNGSLCILCPRGCKVCDLAFTTTSTTTSLFNATTNKTDTVVVSTTTSSVACIICHSGLGLINSICSSCSDANCVRCDYNIYFCLLCSITFTADSNGICKPCAANCNFCDVEGSGTCDEDSCFLGYARFNKSACIRCINGCSSCSPTYPFTCIGCLLGSYALQTNGACANCDRGCNACTGPSSCTSCLFNYNLLNGVCIPTCLLPCVLCSFVKDTHICTNCLQGYSLSNGSCVADFSCMSLSICQFCPLGYFVYRGNCYTCQSHCDACSFNPGDPAFVIIGQNYLPFQNCTQCSLGYYLDANMDCQECASNCISCSAFTMCSKCNASYFLEYKLVNGISSLNYSVGICQKCAPACYQCQSEPNRCTSCKSGFYLTNFICASLTNISFQFTLIDTDNTTKSNMFMNVVSNMVGLYSQIANTLGSIYSSNPHLLMISTIKNGSVIINWYASIDTNSNDPSTVYNSISSNVGQTSTIAGYQLGSSSLVPNGFTPTTPATSTATSYTLYIIIGASILALAVIGLVVFLCLRCRRKKGGQQQSESAKLQKLQTQNQEPATSNNMLKSEDIYPKSSVPTINRAERKKKTQKMEFSHISGNKTVIGEKDQNIKELQGKMDKQNRVSRREISQRENVQHPSRRRQISKLPQLMISRIKQQRKESQEISKRKSEQQRIRQQLSRKKSQERSKSAKHLPDSFGHLQTLNYKSSKNINIPSRGFMEEQNQIRQIERLRNQSYFDQQKTEKIVKEASKGHPKGKSNSIEHRYVPNKNTHFI